MKINKTFLVYLLIIAFIQINFSSCVVKKVNNGTTKGKKKGWYKNPNNPHNPNSTKKDKHY